MHRLPFHLVATLASLLLALIFLTVGVLFWQHDRRDLDDSLRKESAALRTSFEVALADLEQQMLTLASMVAADRDVRDLFRLGKQAVEEEGGGAGGPRSARLRAALYEQVAPAWTDMQQQYGLRQLHFQFGPGSLSYLRVHTPEKFGDRMDGLRHIIEDVNRDQQPRTGFETGRIYSGVRGVVPVWHVAADGTRSYVGALEAGTSFDTQLSRLDRQIGAGFAVLLKQQHVEDAVWEPYRPLNGPRSGSGCDCYLEASSREEVRDWMEQGLLPRLPSPETHSYLLERDGTSWHLTRFPLRDYLGTRDPARPWVGSVLVWRDAGATLTAWKRHHVLTQSMLFGAFLLAQALLLWLLLATRRSLQKRIDEATRALSVSEDMLQRAQSVARLGSWEIDLTHTRIAWSAETYRIFGIEPGTPADYAQFLRQVHPDDRKAVDKAWRAAQQGAPYDIEHRIMVGGEIRWVRERAEFVRNAQGQPLSALGTVHEITELKCMELELRASEERYRSTFAAVEDGLWEWHVPTDRIVWDERSFQMLGYAADAFTVNYATWERLIHPDDLAATAQAVQEQLARGQTFVVEFRYRCADGRWLWVQGRGKVVQWHDGAPLRVVGTHSDISARKRAEEALRTAQARLSTVIENFHGGILLEGEDRAILLSNQTFCELFVPQATPETLIGRDALAVLAGAAERFAQPARAVERIERILAERSAAVGEEIDLADGRALERDYLPILAEGRFLGHLWLYRDISERKARERELHRMATTDLLTGLPNRRHFLERVEQELGRFRRFGTPATLLMIDIDHFKLVNDRHGHAAGDAVLRHFATLAADSLRGIDLLGRLGGEEFAALLPGTDAEGAALLAERLRRRIAEQSCESGGVRIAITISIGLTALQADDDGSDLPLARADAALYRAKQSGRNRVERAPAGVCTRDAAG